MEKGRGYKEDNGSSIIPSLVGEKVHFRVKRHRKGKTSALAISELCLSEGISQSVETLLNRNFKIS